MATAYDNGSCPLGEILNDEGIRSDEKLANKQSVISSNIVASEGDLLKENMDNSTDFLTSSPMKNSFQTKVRESFLKKSKSDRQTTAGKKNKSKVKSFSNIFARKRHDDSSKLKSTQDESTQSGVGDIKPKGLERYNKLDESFDISDTASKDKLRETIFDLSHKIQELEDQLEDSRINASVQRSRSEEYDELHRKIELMNDEIERLEMQVAFLQEEKDDAEKKIKDSEASYEKLSAAFKESDEKRMEYKRKFLAAKTHCEDAISHMVDELNELTEDNRLLVRQGMKGMPREYEKILKVTDEYLSLLTEKNRLYEECEGLVSRLVRQEIKYDDLHREMDSMLSALDQAGIPWSPSSEFEQDYDLYQEEDRYAKENEAVAAALGLEEEEYLSPNEDQLDDRQDNTGVQKRDSSSKIRIPLRVAQPQQSIMKKHYKTTAL